MHLIAGQDRTDLPGPSTFGLLVEDLDACHARAIDAGAAETVARATPGACPGAQQSGTLAATGYGSTRPDPFNVQRCSAFLIIQLSGRANHETSAR
jgi:hypothetical protein